MKILITGSRGQLGRDCMATLAPENEVLGLDLPELDIAAESSVRAAADRFRPHCIVNCAAYTRVDAAETDRAAAHRANAEGPAVLAGWANRNGACLVHLSTDYVFDGCRPPPLPYLETDVPNPQSYYGVSKLAGEQAVQSSGARHAILRTAWLYGLHGANFLKTMLRLALRAPEQPIRVVNDQHGSATWSGRLALQIARVIESGAEGLFHASAEGHSTWFELAGLFLRAMRVPHKLAPITTAEYPTAARRPANSILENARLKEAKINRMEPWDADVLAFADRFRERLLAEARAIGG